MPTRQNALSYQWPCSQKTFSFKNVFVFAPEVNSKVLQCYTSAVCYRIPRIHLFVYVSANALALRVVRNQNWQLSSFLFPKDLENHVFLSNSFVSFEKNHVFGFLISTNVVKVRLVSGTKFPWDI